MKTVSFVIPCYRSEKTVGGVVLEIQDTMRALPQYDYEFVLVNDCSPDGTFAVLRQLAEADPRVTAVDLVKNFGQHAALMCGMRCARGDCAVCLDDDGQTPADEVGKLLQKLEEGYDVVYASYAEKQESGFRRFGSDVNRLMTELMLGKPRELELTSYFAASRLIVDEMLRYEHCYPYVMGLVLRSTKRICNVPVQHRARQSGSSGYTLAKLLGGKLGCTRPLYDRGILPYKLQIGQSGVMVKTKLYLSFGVSGAVNHTAGVDADVFVAVDKNPEAQIFNYCDYGIVGDMDEVCDEMIDQLRAAGRI